MNDNERKASEAAGLRNSTSDPRTQINNNRDKVIWLSDVHAIVNDDHKRDGYIAKAIANLGKK